MLRTRSGLIGLLALFLGFTNLCCAAENVTEPTTYLIPILRFGPNNQKRDLRQVAALAKQLNCGLVLTGLFKHYLDVKAARLETKQQKAASARQLRRFGTESMKDPADMSVEKVQAGVNKHADMNAGHVHGQPNPSVCSTSAPQAEAGSTAGARTLLRPSCHSNHMIREQEHRLWAVPQNAEPAASEMAAGLPMVPPAPVAEQGLQGEQLGGTALAPPGPALPKCFKHIYQYFMDFESVLDRSLLASWLPVATVSELKAKGWDGEIDAYIHREGFGPDEHVNYKVHTDKTLRAMEVNMRENFLRIPVEIPVRCKAATIDKLKETVKPFRVVAVMMYELDRGEFLDFPQIMAPEPKSPCKSCLWQAQHRIRHAPWIQSVATRYVKEHLGDEPYLAVHVRPWPDPCLEVWKAPRLDESALRHRCVKPLHKLLPGKVLSTLQQFQGRPNVFVMAHPAIRHTIHKILQKVNITAVYLSEPVLYQIAGCVDTSATFMAMAEEEVSVQAHAFLGTATSSMTHSIAVERLGAGQRNIQYLDMDDPTEVPVE